MPLRRMDGQSGPRSRGRVKIQNHKSSVRLRPPQISSPYTHLQIWISQPDRPTHSVLTHIRPHPFTPFDTTSPPSRDMPSDLFKAFVTDSVLTLSYEQLKDVVLTMIDSPTADIEEIGKAVRHVKGKKVERGSAEKGKGKESQIGNGKRRDDEMEVDEQQVPEAGLRGNTGKAAGVTAVLGKRKRKSSIS